MESMRQAKFVIDGEPVFSGYTDRRTWNGWETPYFEFETTRQILSKYCTGLSHFDVRRDAFVI